MMSLINTNYSYLQTMQIKKESPIVGIIGSEYYLGCTIGAVIASWLADKKGRRPSIFTCLATTTLGNLLMFVSGISNNGSSPWNGGALACMLAGRVVMGLGVGGIDAVIPVYSSELSSDGARGRALAQEFQMNIFGLLMDILSISELPLASGKKVNGLGELQSLYNIEPHVLFCYFMLIYSRKGHADVPNPPYVLY
jgi:MFS family permease